MTGIVPGLTRDPPSSLPEPSSVIFAPAWVYPMNSNGSAPLGRSVCAMGYHWKVVLADSLPESLLSSVVVVLRGDAAAYTFRWGDGALKYIGPGDRASALVPSARLRRHARSFSANASGMVFGVTLYPTAELEQQYVTMKPRNNALVVIAASLACVLLFGCALSASASSAVRSDFLQNFTHLAYLRARSVYELFIRRHATLINAQLRANLCRLEQMQQDVEAGCAREAQARARLLAEEACTRQKDQVRRVVLAACLNTPAALSADAAARAAPSVRFYGQPRDPYPAQRDERRSGAPGRHLAAER